MTDLVELRRVATAAAQEYIETMATELVAARAKIEDLEVKLDQALAGWAAAKAERKAAHEEDVTAGLAEIGSRSDHETANLLFRAIYEINHLRDTVRGRYQIAEAAKAPILPATAMAKEGMIVCSSCHTPVGQGHLPGCWAKP